MAIIEEVGKIWYLMAGAQQGYLYLLSLEPQSLQLPPGKIIRSCKGRRDAKLYGVLTVFKC